MQNKDSQCTYQRNNEAHSHNHFVVEKQETLHILSLCLQPYSSKVQDASAVFYCHLWPVRMYHIFPYYLTKDTIFGGKKYCT